MAEERLYSSYLFLLESLELPTTIPILEEQPDKVEAVLRVTENFVKKVLKESPHLIPPQPLKKVEILQKMIKEEYITYKVIGTVSSIFTEPNGTPRQGSMAPLTRCKITFLKWVVPEVALKELSEFSHCLVYFKFHLNTNTVYHPLVVPPKRGEKTSVFATRSPHRPNNIGMTVAKIIRVGKDELYLGGIDLVDGTPIVDIKPYTYADSIQADTLQVPDWLNNSSSIKSIVKFDESVFPKLKQLVPTPFYSTLNDFVDVVEEVLALDIRTIHMQQKHTVKRYGVLIDHINVTFVQSGDQEVTVVDVEKCETAKFHSKE
ncbi:hypothetical protein EIN_523490 [Entamoeba invadens IP1]|uniref:TsaA-like domain-containing protein n=2 Tax=Entamoeba invadens TaxID=33085 RepID=A0A0A1UBA4_ENTIV|nr:hypothetical protein EIN_523490 [Entamoeba invadens IP1]ELP92461.1 hypothetical protein EIN_523490 [Entamoeba invadens IP1]BAN42006.1 hypothetical protein, conserved [Entamoeba invadens]|eukprot:XP_004259232.1 hypothetical protein EIN_523490 [Entamoeba invadens IP1]